MPEINLKVTVDPGQHWMLNSRRIGVFTKTIHVDDVSTVKFIHTEVSQCLFTSSSNSYDAIRYGDDILHLQFDTQAGRYSAFHKRSYSQSAHQQDWVEYWRQKRYADWALELIEK